MFLGIIAVAFSLSTVNLTIVEPVDGQTYNGDWLTVKAIVENDNEVPQIIEYSLNGQSAVGIPRLNTDWYTYMQNDLHQGYSESPAPHESTVLWAAPVCGTFHEFCSPVIVNDILYFGSLCDTTLYALDPATGIQKWSYKLLGWVDDAVTVKNNRVYVTADSLWCLDAVSGERYWAFADSAADGMVGTSPVVTDDCVYVCSEIPYDDFALHALDIETGEELWRVQYPYVMMSCITLYENVLYVPTWEGPLYGLDASDGSILWENSDSESGYWDSSPMVFDGSVFILGEGTLRVNATSGISEWISEFGYGEATPSVHNGVVFSSGYDGDFFVYALNAATGETIWTHPIEYLHGSTGVADGLVFFGDNLSGTVYALDEFTGEEVWSYSTVPGTHGIGSSPAITDGVMYLACTDGYLYAFGTGLKYTYLDDLFAETGSNQLIVTSLDGGVPVCSDTVNFTVTCAGIDPDVIPELGLHASPNPFNSLSSISFALSHPGYTSVEVFDLSGRALATIISSELSAGEHSVHWDGRDDKGDSVATGLYMCRIFASGQSETIGLCLLR